MEDSCNINKVLHKVPVNPGIPEVPGIIPGIPGISGSSGTPKKLPKTTQIPYNSNTNLPPSHGRVHLSTTGT